jgi:hypothetical protein
VNAGGERRQATSSFPADGEPRCRLCCVWALLPSDRVQRLGCASYRVQLCSFPYGRTNVQGLDVSSDICLGEKATGMCSVRTGCYKVWYVCQWDDVLVRACECWTVFVPTYG